MEKLLLQFLMNVVAIDLSANRVLSSSIGLPRFPGRYMSDDKPCERTTSLGEGLQAFPLSFLLPSCRSGRSVVSDCRQLSLTSKIPINKNWDIVCSLLFLFVPIRESVPGNIFNFIANVGGSD